VLLLLVAAALPVLAWPTLTAIPERRCEQMAKRQPDPDGGFATNF
jgi:hypothetical protein